MNLFHENVIQTILTSEHPNNVSSIRILDWKIDGMTGKCIITYASVLSRLIIRYQLEIEKNAPWMEKIFIIKDPTKAPIYNYIKIMGWYDNEVMMYNEVLPKMFTFIEDECFAPRLHYFNDEMLLVLEDLSETGYKCGSHARKLDFEHCIHALRSLAKFHALSVKLESTLGLPELVKRNALFNTTRVRDLAIAIAKRIPPFIDSIPQHIKHLYPNMITQFRNLSAENLIDIKNSSSCYKFNVLNHGDFSINNIMYNYDAFGTVRHVKIIDFQLSHWSSPANDLLFFTITSMKFEVYQKYFPVLLKIYLDTLRKILCQLGCPTPAYDVQSLLDDMDTLYPYALYILSCVMPFIMIDPNDPHDAESVIKDGMIDFSNGKNVLSRKNYQETMIRWLEHFAKKDSCIFEKW
ncbi:uncharacterized protein LOC135831381 [Planococcus citri]|uniref:uncharacterized protein LOC135831381 n=1 Tax=Planococcus citri TaxID=170843 RepID=UPI0031F85680